MAAVDLPKFVQLTLEEAVPASAAERLARTSLTPHELVVRRMRLRRIVGMVLVGATVLLLVAVLVGVVRAHRSAAMPRTNAVQSTALAAPADVEAQPTNDDSSAARGSTVPVTSPRATPAPERPRRKALQPKKSMLRRHSS
jgi:hypothetical protein